METIKLFPTKCAICNTEGNASEVYPANLDMQAFNPRLFSARRVPDRIHYRMVRCNKCGLVRSDPTADAALEARLYRESAFQYGDEVVNLRITYGRHLANLSNQHGAHKGSLLEIGCGNGFFLEEAMRQGYVKVRGVEPSVAAVEKASSIVRPYIICDIMHPGLFGAGEYDVICMFQLLDHVPDPGSLLDESFRLLKPRGLVLCINHNIEAMSARLFKERSPIIDIEHTYLYSQGTISRMFAAHGFRVIAVGAVCNNYSLYYLTQLVPIPAALKAKALRLLKESRAGRVQLRGPLGNLYLIAEKCASSHRH